VLLGPEEAPAELPELAAEPPDELPLEAAPAELPEEAPPAPAPAPPPPPPPPCANAKAEPSASTDASASVATFMLFPCGWLAKKQKCGFVDCSGTQCEAIHIFQPVGRCKIGLVPTAEFVEADQTDLGCPVPFAKTFRFRSDPNQNYKPRHPVPDEGRIAIVTDVGHGMRWTLMVLLTNSA
jgi:hypothetical protein